MIVVFFINMVSDSMWDQLMLILIILYILLLIKLIVYQNNYFNGEFHMEKKSFIVQVPDEPGALHKAAWISKQYQANIHRIHYNRK